MALHNEIGHLGENAACEYLVQHGYRIRERNWRLGNIEIDIIAENKTSIVFVEVKTRTTTFAGVNPELYVDEHKRRFMTVAGNAYLKQNRIDKNLQFDICGILWDSATNAPKEIHYYEDAFSPKLRTRNANSFNGQWRWHRR
ncbi:MAG: YraN family protein [Paludibacteraceae bacterium]|nr:YraN family protein [Paludibacteraceae bacterium]